MTCPFCKFDHKIMVPTIHNNGTAAEDLRDELHAAVQALAYLIARLVAASPNARDYYPQGNDAITRVQAEHIIRLENIQAVGRELTEMRGHVQTVIDYVSQKITDERTK